MWGRRRGTHHLNVAVGWAKVTMFTLSTSSGCGMRLQMQILCTDMADGSHSLGRNACGMVTWQAVVRTECGHRGESYNATLRSQHGPCMLVSFSALGATTVWT